MGRKPIANKGELKATIVDLRREGLPFVQIAKRCGIAAPTVWQWMREDPKFAAAVKSAYAEGQEVGDESGMDRLKVGAKGGRGSAEFAAFRKIYFGFETFPHQQRMVDAIEFMGPRDIAMCLVWPEAGKTTTLEDWICWKLAVDPNHRITYVSESINHARKVAGRVKSRMTDTRNNQLYIAKYGPFYVEGQERENKPWTKDYFTVNKVTWDERDYSVECRAWTSKALGTRIDTLIIDDTQSRTSLVRTEEMFDTIRSTYLTRGRQMRIIIIGTRLAPGDIYERFLNAQPSLIHAKKLIILRAEGDDGQPTEPRMWVPDEAAFDSETGETDALMSPKEFMELIKGQVGPEVWFASYQQNPVLNSLATFTAELVQEAMDDARTEKRSDPDSYVILSLDPALGGGNALMAQEFTRESLNLLDLDVAHNLARTEDILQRLETFAIRYRPVEVVIEEAAFQKGLVNDERLRVMGKERGFRIIPHTTSRNKSDPVMGVASMAGSFIRGEVSIPNGNAYVQDRFQPLQHQLRSWRPNVSGKMLTQDTVMALWFGWRRWMDFKKVDLGAANWRMSALPWKPTSVGIGLPLN